MILDVSFEVLLLEPSKCTGYFYLDGGLYIVSPPSTSIEVSDRVGRPI